MTTEHPYIVEPLSKQHDKSSFSCGVQALDAYLKTQAGQDAKKQVASPFILLDTKQRKVAGYYTLSMNAIIVQGLPEKITKKLPRYPHLPAVLMGRLAIDETYKGRKLGSFLLIDALKRAYAISASIAATFFVVDAKDEQAKGFYQHFGFVALKDDTRRLYLPMKTIGKIP